MGTTLDNGTYLPDEGERNCYEGLAGNWVALDNHLGSTNIHVTINDKQAWNGHIADTTIHVTSADKESWNNHIADTVKHVTAEDKAKWDTVTGKASDADVVHKSGDETINGNKTFSSINGVEPSSLGMPDLSNGIDISSYITPGNSNNTYTPLVNGYVSVNIGIASGGCAVFLSQGDLYNACYSATGAPNVTGVSARCMLPVKGGVQMNIGLKGSNNYINSAKFYPCLGNV